MQSGVSFGKRGCKSYRIKFPIYQLGTEVLFVSFSILSLGNTSYFLDKKQLTSDVYSRCCISSMHGDVHAAVM